MFVFGVIRISPGFSCAKFVYWESLSRDVHFVKDQFPCHRGSVPKAIMNNLESVELDDDVENQVWTMPPDHMGKT